MYYLSHWCCCIACNIIYRIMISGIISDTNLISFYVKVWRALKSIQKCKHTEEKYSLFFFFILYLIYVTPRNSSDTWKTEQNPVMCHRRCVWDYDSVHLTSTTLNWVKSSHKHLIPSSRIQPEQWCISLLAHCRDRKQMDVESKLVILCYCHMH